MNGGKWMSQRQTLINVPDMKWEVNSQISQQSIFNKSMILNVILWPCNHPNWKHDAPLTSKKASCASLQNTTPLHGFAWIRPGPCAVCMRTGKVIRYAEKGSGKGVPASESDRSHIAPAGR